MNNIEEAFFILMRSALWHSNPILPRTLSKDEWIEIYDISKEQTVSGILLDAIIKLPKEQKPETSLRLQWIVQQKRIENLNKRMNSALCSLISEMDEFCSELWLLKGQGVALNYIVPEHRICGDIDIYFTPDNFEPAMKFFRTNKYVIEGDPEDSHYETEYKGFKVEIHKKSATFYTKRLQKRYNEIISSIISTDAEYAIFEDKKAMLLPPLANALQMLSHMLRHIIFSGLGLRQICDWVMFTYKCQHRIDKELFIKYMKELQLFETYKVVTAIAVDYLGLAKEFTICELSPKDKKLAKKVFQLIMTYGNFGHYGEHSIATSKKEYLKSYFWKIKNCWHFRKLSRSETWNYPLWQLHSIKWIITSNKYLF